MCLAVPGRIISLDQEKGTFPQGVVDFQGSRVQVSLALVPEAAPGDWVLVHAGFAIGQVDADEAAKTLEMLRQYSDAMVEL